MENTKMDLYENYLNRAKKYLVEDEEDLELTDVDTEEDTDIDDVADDTDAGEEDGAEEPVELDMANPVCPECGATLIPVGEIDTTEEDEDGNPLYDDDEADAIDLLQGLGYVIYKPVADEDAVDDDFAGSDDEDFGDEEDLDDEENEDEE
jgi:hypothetical protein